jgi:hypothetical protein
MPLQFLRWRKSLAGPKRILGFALLLCAFAAASLAQGREEEIVANLAAGRVIVHVASEGIVFATIEQSAEADSVAPRVISIDSGHIGILLGAAQWQIPAGSEPIFVEKKLARAGSAANLTPRADGLVRLEDENADLELIGVAFLEALRPLASQLHHKVELGPDEPLLEIVVIGHAPQSYGPEIWLYEYRMVQEAIRGDYYQTRVLRPRTTQLYPPAKHEPRTMVELCYPANSAGPSLVERIQRNDPLISRLASADPKFARVVEKIQAGKANGAKASDAADFLRAVVVPLAGKARFAVGTLSERGGLEWLVPPEAPIQKVKREREDKEGPAEAPTLRPRPKP